MFAFISDWKWWDSGTDLLAAWFLCTRNAKCFDWLDWLKFSDSTSTILCCSTLVVWKVTWSQILLHSIKSLRHKTTRDYQPQWTRKKKNTQISNTIKIAEFSFSLAECLAVAGRPRICPSDLSSWSVLLHFIKNPKQSHAKQIKIRIFKISLWKSKRLATDWPARIDRKYTAILRSTNE